MRGMGCRILITVLSDFIQGFASFNQLIIGDWEEVPPFSVLHT